MRREEGEACTYPARASLPAALAGSRNWLKGSWKGEKESKQSQRKAWSSKCWDCLVWRSHLLGHSRQLCRQIPTPPPHVCVHTHAHIRACIHNYTRAHTVTQLDMHIYTQRWVHTDTYADIHTHMHRHTARKAQAGGQVLGWRISVAPSSSTSLLPSFQQLTLTQALTAITHALQTLPLSSKLFTYTNLFNPHSSPRRQAL